MERKTWQYGNQIRQPNTGDTTVSSEGDRRALLCRKIEGEYITYESLSSLPITDKLWGIGTVILSPRPSAPQILWNITRP